MIIPIVDKDDNELCTKPIAAVDWQHEIYRVSGLWLLNETGEVLCAQRAFTKEQSPGTWGPSAAGIVEADETYEENILKETEEEVGVSLSKDQLILGPKQFITNHNPSRRYYLQWFFAHCNKSLEEIVIQEDEVAAVKWVDPQTLQQDLAADPNLYCDVSPEVLTVISKL